MPRIGYGRKLGPVSGSSATSTGYCGTGGIHPKGTVELHAQGHRGCRQPFTPGNVRRILASTTAAACGVGETVFQAYRRWIRHIFRRLGLMAERRSVAGEVMPAWQPLLTALTDDKAWIRLRAFIRYCSAHGAGPAMVDDALLAGYARYNSDLQSPASIEDQLCLCTAHAEREGWIIAGTFMDAAISGATTIRPG